MKSGYFRVLRFEPEKGELELAEDGLDDPGARIAYFEEPYVPYGLIVLDDGTRFECDQLAHEIFRNLSNNAHRKTLGKTQKMPINAPVKP